MPCIKKWGGVFECPYTPMKKVVWCDSYGNVYVVRERKESAVRRKETRLSPLSFHPLYIRVEEVVVVVVGVEIDRLI